MTLSREEEEDEYGVTMRSTTRGRNRRKAVAELLDPNGGPRLVMGRVLGKGSMGVVREAHQRALGRAVAVKAPLTREDEDIASILQEAWVAGALEHPNIVPVYDIEIVDGVPHVVMKKLDGTSWSDLVNKPEAIRERFPDADPLEWNLRVLVAVCHAVEYAHSKGVLHLDIKPSNVMIGAFGEVHLVDWGVAVSLVEEHADRLPLARDQHEVSGTPAYMAPEMAQGDGSRLSERADVYLLGAVLYRILAGRPPRTGNSVEAVYKALTRPVSVDPHWPLADILRAALTTDPDARTPSVAAFRGAVESWLSRRGALALAASAREKLDALRRATESTAERGDAAAYRAGVYDLFSACRFGFQEALRAWPDQPEARAGLRDALERMVRFEVEQGDDRAAALHLRQLDHAPAELVAAVEAVRQRRKSARAEFESLRSDADPKVAWEARVVVMAAIGAVWVGTPIGSSLMGVPQGYARELAIAIVTALLSAVVVAGLAPWLVKSRMNRLFIIVMVLGPALAALLNVGCWLAGAPSELAGAIELFVYFSLSIVVCLLAEWRLIPGALGFLAAFLLAMALPGTTLFWMGIANVIVVVNALVIWLPYRFRNQIPQDVPFL